ncbi:MAG: helix-turn-helix domain-containing protein [Brevinematales bacterium]|jgi:hypothetical protein
MNEKRDFKGVWIPKAIYLCSDLSANEKLLLAEIDSLSQLEDGCFASNEYFANFLGVSIPTVTRSISHLKKLKLISVISFDGHIRKLSSNIRVIIVPDQNDETDKSKGSEALIKKMNQPDQNDQYINTGNKTNIKSLSQAQIRNLVKKYVETLSYVKNIPAYVAKCLKDRELIGYLVTNKLREEEGKRLEFKRREKEKSIKYDPPPESFEKFIKNLDDNNLYS